MSAMDSAYEFNLPAGDLSKALDVFSAQAGVQVGYAPEIVSGKQARAVRGRLGWREALGQLLEGSGIGFRQINDSSIVIERSGNPNATVGPSSTVTSPKASAPGQDEPVTDIESITVTGTRIRGGATPSPVITIGSERIREEGFTDIGEVIRSLPQNFSGGQNPGVAVGATAGAGGLANQNVTGGSALNLRGLGPDATLTLLNGRRMAYGGFVQAVDISAIPVEAVDRVEIVADGASAIYGSDAVGGVGNVILKRGYEGTTVSTRYAGATDGGLATHDYALTTGRTWATGGLIATYKDTTVDPIYADQRSYTQHLNSPTTIYPDSDLRSGLVSAYQGLGDALELRLDALRTKRKQDYSYYASTASQAYQHVTPETTMSLVSPSIEIRLPSDWTLSAGGTWSKDEHLQRQSAVNRVSGAVSALYDECYCNESRTYEASAEGPLFVLPSGEARLAVGAGYRTSEFKYQDYLGGTVVTQGREASRFWYAEANLPLIGPAADGPSAERLTLIAAIRGEDYDSFGRVSTPRLGLIYRPTGDFTLKASWGKSFKVPTLYQQYTAQVAWLLPPDDLGTGYADDATVLFMDGGNPNLKPERARTWSASLAFHPERLPGLDAELSWFSIDYTDRVVQPITNSVNALSNPAYAQFVDLEPTADAQAAVLARADSFQNYAGAAYDPAKVIAILYTQYVNATQQRIHGVDLSASYRMELGAGRLTIRGAGSWLDLSQQTTPTEPYYALSGTLFSPAKIAGRVGMVWEQGRFSASTFADYTDGVSDTVTGSKQGSFTTVSARISVATADQGGPWSGLEVALTAENLLNRDPPLYAAGATTNPPYDSTNYSAMGRVLGISLSKTW
jgi:outer membrane receptor protein involved in Fe transport